MNPPKGQLVQRYSVSERVNHWITAITFMLLSFSGLALFHPALFWFSLFFGGGTWTRILHPFIGVLMFLSFWGLALRFLPNNLLDRNDWQWLRRTGDVLRNREDRLPEVGRYNAGQKLLFWIMALTTPVLLVTGIMIWRPWFSPLFTIGGIRWAVLLHSISAFVLIAGIIVHFYAALWVKGSMNAMLRGTVGRAWAAKHHPGWYKQVTGADPPKIPHAREKHDALPE